MPHTDLDADTASATPSRRAAQPDRTLPRPTAMVGEALGEAIHKLRGKDLAVAAAVGIASYWLLRPRGGEARTEAWAGLRDDLIGQMPRRAAGAARASAAAADVGLLPIERRGVRGAGLALLGSGVLRQGARWLWRGTRVAGGEAVARLGRRRPGVIGGVSQLFAQASAWRERHALVQARRDLDADLRALRRAVRRRG